MSRVTSHARKSRGNFPGSMPQNLKRYGARIARLWPDHTQREIAKRLGVSQYSVSRWGEALGLVTPRPTRPKRSPLTPDPRVPELYRCVCGGISTDPDSVDVCTHARGAA